MRAGAALRLTRQVRAEGLTFGSEWLGFCTTTTDGWLLERAGQPYRLAWSAPARGATCLRDVATWEWVSPCVVRFIPQNRLGDGTMRRPPMTLCTALLYNYPPLMYRHRDTDLLRPIPTKLEEGHEWRVLHGKQVSNTLIALPTAMHQARTTTEINHGVDGQVQFRPNPALTRLVWQTSRPWQSARTVYPASVAARRVERGQWNRDAAAAPY